MNRLVNAIDIIVGRFWLIFCSLIFLTALIIKAMYAMNDSPYFEWSSFGDLLLTAGLIAGVYLVFRYREKIECNFNYLILIAFFGIIGVCFVFSVPLKPFSDMQYVVDGALYFAQGDIDGILASEYLQLITKNLKISIFYGFFALFLPKTVISFRIINVILYLLIAFFMGKVADNMGYHYPKTVFILTASFLPLLLYCNHVYFDLPALCMCTIAIHFYTSDKNWKNMICAAVCLGIGSSLRELAYLFAAAMVIDLIFHYKKELFQKHGRRLIIVFVFVSILYGIPQISNRVVNTFFRTEGAESESIWTQFWMGINEEEFGFMHNEIFDGQKEFADFYDLLTSRNVEQNIRLFGRKIFWTWSQGTYQAQRYGFGGDVEDELDKFEYSTPLTKYLKQDKQKGRNLINMLCRAEYMAWFFFMIIGLLNLNENERDHYRVLIYLMFGTFLILIFYEMKSRYILHCLIPMMVLAIRGMGKFPMLLRMYNPYNKYNSKDCTKKKHQK